MICALLLIVLLAGVSFYYTDIASESALASVLMPILLVLSLIALALWLVVFFHRRGISQHTERGGGGGFDSFGDGGGDAG